MSIYLPDEDVICRNLSAQGWATPRGEEHILKCPYNGQKTGSVRYSSHEDIASVLAGAQQASKEWGLLSTRERSVPLQRLFRLLNENMDALARTAAAEAGKTFAEARAEVMKGIEVTEFALGIQNMDRGASVEVSRGVTCTEQRASLGVVAAAVPFNFPAMIPLWMTPIAMTLGNAFVLKPSEAVPKTAIRLGELILEAGYPAGIFNLIQGDKSVVEQLLADPIVRSFGFVGSSPAAQAVFARAGQFGKRSLALGGAKNFMILMEDADPELASSAIVDSFTGCAGQRCMAGSVLIAVGKVDAILDKIISKASQLKPGISMGAIISPTALSRIHNAINAAASQNVKILLDGRHPSVAKELAHGNWLAPSILDAPNSEVDCVKNEIFGPVLSILRCPDLESALHLENQSLFGNATSIFTNNGSVAKIMTERASTGMLGINVGIPVPREPFSFGGRKNSKFGQGDITGEASFGLWSDLKKITTRWSQQGKTVF